MKRAIFLDRDGTISEEVGYLSDAAQFKLLDRAAEAIRLINESGYLAIVITNQSGVARGYFDEATVKDVNSRMTALLHDKGAHLDGVYYCPHHPDHGEAPYKKACGCRKPATGMLESARDDLSIDLAGSFMVGDKRADIECAKNAGLKGVLVLTGYGRETSEALNDDDPVKPDHTAKDIYDAVKWIIEQQ